MAEWAISCNGAVAPRAEHGLDLHLTGPDRNFRLEIENIAQAMAASVPPRLLDVLEIASLVFAADQSIRRGGDTRVNWGSAWRRHLRFHIPVRDLEFWQRAIVCAALSAVLRFLSEDAFDFSFEQANAPPSLQDYLRLDPGADQGFSPDEILLFSGGADSLAGAIETLEAGRRVALVSHRSAPKILKFQRELANELRRRYRGRVLPLRVYAARFNAGDAPERTQRNRSFLYAALGFVAARMFGIRRVRFFENGVVSINLPIAGQVIGSMATRTTHPYAIRLMREFFSLVAGEAILLDNPFTWRTKAEVFESLRSHGAEDLVGRTVSCSNVYQRTRAQTHCGECSQCLDRRYGTLAAGLGTSDPADMYETDLLAGARETPHSQVMAVEYTRHGVDLASMPDAVFSQRFGGELARLREGFPDLPADEVGERCFDLHARQGEAVRRVFRDAVRGMSDQIVDRQLPPTSLLALHLGDIGRKGSDPHPREPQPVAAARFEPPGAERDVSPPRGPEPTEMLELSWDDDRVEILDHGGFAGRPAHLLLALIRFRLQEEAEGRRAAEFQPISADDLADALDERTPNAATVDVPAIRQLVSRIRKDLAEIYELIGGGKPPADMLVETVSRHGYRLNTTIRLVRSPAP